MATLDKYLGTSDEHFNYNAQHIYFEFDGRDKPNFDKGYEVFISIIHEVYFFTIDNADKPFACVDKFEEVTAKAKIADDDKVLVLDYLLGIISNHPGAKEKLTLVLMQLVNHRENLSSYECDPEIISYMNSPFNPQNLLEELRGLNNPQHKIELIAQRLSDLKEREKSLSKYEKVMLEEDDFVGVCHEIYETIFDSINPGSPGINTPLLDDGQDTSPFKMDKPSVPIYGMILALTHDTREWPVDSPRDSIFKEVANKVGLSPNTLYTAFLACNDSKKRSTKDGKKLLQRTIPYLKDYPKALKMAKAELGIHSA